MAFQRVVPHAGWNTWRRPSSPVITIDKGAQMAEYLLIQTLALAVCILLAMPVLSKRDRARPPQSVASVGWH